MKWEWQTNVKQFTFNITLEKEGLFDCFQGTNKQTHTKAKQTPDRKT